MNQGFFKAKRKEKNISQRELALLADVSEQFVYYIEKGERRPSPEKAQVFGKILDFDWRLFYESMPTA